MLKLCSSDGLRVADVVAILMEIILILSFRMIRITPTGRKAAKLYQVVSLNRPLKEPAFLLVLLLFYFCFSKKKKKVVFEVIGKKIFLWLFLY